MKGIKTFKVFIIVVFALSIVFFGIHFAVTLMYKGAMLAGERDNELCDTDQRLFDETYLLDIYEREKIEKLITKYEEKLGFDIVIVFLDEDIGTLDEYETDTIRNWTINFYEEHKFGWDTDDFDGVIFVANFYDGAFWTEFWGRPYYDLTTSEQDKIINSALEVLRENPYKAAKNYIKGLGKRLIGFGFIDISWWEGFNLIIAAVISIIFLLFNMKEKTGKETVTKESYVSGGAPDIEAMDEFISKKITMRSISSDSSGGGGSGGGGGGGGHGGGGGRF